MESASPTCLRVLRELSATGLRKWCHANYSRYVEFVAKYQHELEERQADIQQTIESITHQTMILVTSIKDPVRSYAIVLQKFLRNLISNG